MDMTHVSQFGRLKYVHVSVDTFSGAIYASAHTGEKSGDVIKHLLQAFSFMGIPRTIKTDNGLGYTSKELCSFLQQWGVEHKTGIPHSPTGQAIVERMHQNIKRVLSQQTQILKFETPQIHLARALYTLDFLNCSFESMNPLIIHHFGGNKDLEKKEQPLVLVKDPETMRTEGPHDLITWGRGYACVSRPSGLKWVPAKWFQILPEARMSCLGALSLIHVLQLAVILGLIDCATTWIVPQPKANVWRTLTMAMGQDHICLSQGSVKDPISSCLVGIPFKEAEYPPALLNFEKEYNAQASNEEITRQATLQNRAAIDYLLLLHHHTCEEFEGLCCFNLSSWAEDVWQSIKKIKDMVHEIKRETKDWWDNLFGNWGLSGWIGSAIKTSLLILFLLLIVGIAFGLTKRLTRRLISDAASTLNVNHVWTTSPPLEEIELQNLPPQEVEDEEETDSEDFLLEDEGQWPMPFESWPTNQQWFGDLYPNSEYLAPQPQFNSF
ncbi:hypothetical protein HGM15179_016282 [Zosterops borbonicus]|uniref:Integrase n=1 Tax=Zosterops borbonicus TaxID=364589 RepID=A0A8K1G329_9PASS|nr:hypothetical protein HGM15179_016282 [Zosterops borbonicus]